MNKPIFCYVKPPNLFLTKIETRSAQWDYVMMILLWCGGIKYKRWAVLITECRKKVQMVWGMDRHPYRYIHLKLPNTRNFKNTTMMFELFAMNTGNLMINRNTFGT